jgi:hypothetical protein
MMAAAEAGSRAAWPQYLRDTVCIGHLQNCTVRLKSAEGPEEIYSYNDCGYRSKTSCLPAPPGVLRIASLGTSIAGGYLVGEADMFVNRAAQELSQSLDVPVDSQTITATRIGNIPAKIPLVLAVRPQVIVLTLSATDLAIDEQRVPRPVKTVQSQKPTKSLQAGLRDTFTDLQGQSRALLMIKHALLSRDAYLYDTYLRLRDPADELSQPESPAFTRRYARLDDLLRDISDRMRGHDIPVFLVPAIRRVAAGMLGDGVTSPGTDPVAFQRRVARLAAEHGMFSVDIATPFQAVPHAERMFYPADGHPGPAAHAVIGHALALGLSEYFQSQGDSQAGQLAARR